MLLFLGVLFLSCCRGIFVNEDVATRALETQGFSEIQIVDKDWLFVSLRGGGREDAVRFTAIATNPVGKQVKVFVFAGWPFKGATIRTK